MNDVSVYRRAARAVALECPGTPAERRQVLEMLGLAAPSGREILTDLRPALSPPGRRRPSRRKAIEHGTNGGYSAHVRRKEEACEECAQAQRDYAAQRRRDAGKAVRGPGPISHGTAGGARTHRKRSEKPCAPCIEAERSYRRYRRLVKRERELAWSNA